MCCACFAHGALLWKLFMERPSSTHTLYTFNTFEHDVSWISILYLVNVEQISPPSWANDTWLWMSESFSQQLWTYLRGAHLQGRECHFNILSDSCFDDVLSAIVSQWHCQQMTSGLFNPGRHSNIYTSPRWGPLTGPEQDLPLSRSTSGGGGGGELLP